METAPAFPNLGITRETLESQVRRRMDTPKRIDQEGASLCGPASLIYTLANRDQQAYYDYVMGLYDHGEAKIGSLRVQPGEDCKNYAPQNIDAADWIALASLRDSENYWLDYDSEEDQISGITLPGALAGWCQAAGWDETRNSTNFYFNKSEGHLLEAHSHHQAGKAVCVFVDMYILSNKSDRSWLRRIVTTPNHWEHPSSVTN